MQTKKERNIDTEIEERQRYGDREKGEGVQRHSVRGR